LNERHGRGVGGAKELRPEAEQHKMGQILWTGRHLTELIKLAVKYRFPYSLVRPMNVACSPGDCWPPSTGEETE